METHEERMSDARLDESQLREMTTGDLVRHALDEAKLLARAEVLHAKQELREELKAAKTSGILLGAGFVAALCGLSVLFVALALLIPIREWLAVLLVAVVLLGAAGASAYVAIGKPSKKPMNRTQQRLKKDLAITREQMA